MKAVKGFFRFLLVVIVIVLVFLIAIICTYVLGSPKTDLNTDSRNIVSGPWTEVDGADKDGDLYKFDFNQSGEFKIVKGEEQLADGWFKIDEKSHKIKLLMLPSHYTDEFADYVNYKVLSEVSYSNLKFQIKDAEFGKDPEVIKDKEPSITLLMRANEDSNADTLVIGCKMYEYTLDLFSSEHDLTRDA